MWLRGRTEAGAQWVAGRAEPQWPFDPSLGPTSIERAIKSVGEQIDAKRTIDAARLQS